MTADARKMNRVLLCRPKIRSRNEDVEVSVLGSRPGPTYTLPTGRSGGEEFRGIATRGEGDGLLARHLRTEGVVRPGSRWERRP
jgi:hypothetical protein